MPSRRQHRLNAISRQFRIRKYFLQLKYMNDIEHSLKLIRKQITKHIHSKSEYVII